MEAVRAAVDAALALDLPERLAAERPAQDAPDARFTLGPERKVVVVESWPTNPMPELASILDLAATATEPSPERMRWRLWTGSEIAERSTVGAPGATPPGLEELDHALFGAPPPEAPVAALAEPPAGTPLVAVTWEDEGLTLELHPDGRRVQRTSTGDEEVETDPPERVAAVRQALAQLGGRR